MVEPNSASTTTGITLLVLGARMHAKQVDDALSWLHQHHGLARILVDHDPIVSDWADPRFERGCGPCSFWEGSWQMMRGARPPLTGLDRIKAILDEIDALNLSPHVLVMGAALGFNGSGQRVRAWDASADTIIRAVQKAGLSGWVMVDDGRLRELH